MTRRGWSAVEVLVVVALAALLASLCTAVITASARAAVRQRRALDRERLGQTVGAWWRAALRDAEGGDVEVASPVAITMKQPVGGGAVCWSDADTLRIARTEWRASRDPEPGRDLLWLLRDAVQGQWEAAELLLARAGRCPDGALALELLLATPVATVQLVRVVEPLQLRLYRSGVAAWLGEAPADGSSPVQPVAGPVVLPASQFTRDSSGVHVLMQPAWGGVLLLNAALSPP
ncbi:MAG: hypothetical protein ABJC19_07150 [Gemmatimonadota bacterium]